MLEILFCLGLVFVCAIISYLKVQKLEKEFLLGSVRVILQLYLLGYFLEWIFRHQSFLLVVVVAIFMTMNSIFQIKSRVEIFYKGLWFDAFMATVLSIWPLAIVGAYLLKAQPLWRVDLFLPLLGMLLGNTLNGISLGINFFMVEFHTKKDEVISNLALGATADEATHFLRNRSLKTALTPLLNSMSSMGLVSIPGMMTGQILGGESPVLAAMVQIIMMLLMICGTYFATSFAISQALRKKFIHGSIPC